MTAAPEVLARHVRPVGGGFSERAWARAGALREHIDALPFLRGLADGTLPTETFRHYLEQDSAYLHGYARALAGLAARAPDAGAAELWSGAATGAVVAERELHADLLELLGPGHDRPEPSPTTQGYRSWLVATAATASYPVAVAAVLPCFWVYADVGARLAGHAETVPDHPYARWVRAYADPAFAAVTGRAVAALDDVAARVTAAEQAEMAAAFDLAVRYEWMFWDAADRRESWPLRPVLPGAGDLV